MMMMRGEVYYGVARGGFAGVSFKLHVQYVPPSGAMTAPSKRAVHGCVALECLLPVLLYLLLELYSSYSNQVIQ